MPGPIRRTPSYKASDFLKPEYRRSPTPEINPDQPSTSSTDRGTPTGCPSTHRRRTARDWQVSPEKDTDWAVSSASSSDDERSGRPTRISMRSSTRKLKPEPSSPATGAEPDDDTTSIGGIDFTLGESSSHPTAERPPCPDETCPGSLGPICSVPCAVKDFTVDPTPEEQRLQHKRMQRDNGPTPVLLTWPLPSLTSIPFTFLGSHSMGQDGSIHPWNSSLNIVFPRSRDLQPPYPLGIGEEYTLQTSAS